MMQDKGQKKRKETAKTISVMGMLLALAMILSYIEALLPFSIGIPGVKLGLANLVILSGLYYMNPGQVACILVSRIVLSGFLFGNMAMIIYSLAGGGLSFLMMWFFSRRKIFSMRGVSILGGVTHNMGQLFVAMAAVQSKSLLVYGPTLLIAGTVCGALVGILASILVPLIRRERLDR